MVDNARKRLLELGLVALVGAIWTLLCVPLSMGVERSHGVWRIPSLLAESVVLVFLVAAPVVSLAVLAFAAFQRRWLVMAATIAIAAFGGMMAITMMFFGTTDHAGDVRVTAADGHEYILLASGFQDWQYWLGRVETTSPAETVARPIAETSDYSSPTVRLVRPRGSESSGGVRTSADGRYVVVEIWPACASIAYDTRTKQIWSSELNEQDVSTIVGLSPFILLDDDDELHPADVAALRGESVCPRSKSLSELDPASFADHPNAAVRALFDNASAP